MNKIREAAAKLMADIIESEDPESASLAISTASSSYVLTYRRKEEVHLPIITICGSTRFKREYEEAAKYLERQGWAVFTVGFFMHADNISVSNGDKDELDRLHEEKIAISDAIYVVNPGGYIGDSTRSEIDYAHGLGKIILSLEPLTCPLCGKPSRDGREHKECIDRETALADREK